MHSSMNIEDFFIELGRTKYGRDYLKFIRSEKNYSNGVRTEAHHIFPRALGGSNSENNLVRLSIYDHIIAHIYLAKAIPCKETLLPITWMSRKNVRSLSELERTSLEEIQDWVELREKARETCSKLIHNSEALKKSMESSIRTRTEKYGTCTSYMHTEEVRAKALETIAQKYGGDSAGQLHTEEVKNKVRETKLKKYGSVVGNLHSEEARRKAKENSRKVLLEKYGRIGRPENLKDPEVHARAVANSRKTRVEKYGSVTGAMQTPEARANRQRTKDMKKKYRNSLEFKAWWEHNKSGYPTESQGLGAFVKMLIKDGATL